MSMVIMIVTIFPVLTNIAFIEMVPERMAIGLVILVLISVTFSGSIFTHSLAQYIINRRFRSLIFIFLAANLILTSILYLLTNASMESLLPFADRDRNRTIVVAFALAIAPTILFGSIAEDTELDKTRIYALILWSGILTPLVSIWFFISPEPLFSTTIPGQGLSFISVIILICITPLFAIAMLKHYLSWQRNRNRQDLASFLSTVLWIYAIVLFFLQSNPLQYMEIIWLSVFISGELLITLVTISKEMIKPQQSLSSLVDIRTEELSESKRESEFYLNIWGHKIGNLLQSLTLYLELFSSGKKSVEDLTSIAETALDIGHEADQINKQVAALIRLKEKEKHELVPVNLVDAIKSSCRVTEEIYGSSCFSKSIEYPIDTIYVQGDELLETALENLFLFICRHDSDRMILIYPTVKSEKVTINVDFDEPRLSKDIEESLFSSLQPAHTTMSLDLFLVKILMERYGGKLEYEWVETSRKNHFLLTFNRDFSKVTEQDLVEKQMVSSK